ncbi:MAG: DsbA family protein [Rhodospirillaceae bacterium]
MTTKSAAKLSADWFFDVISPYAYLQWREMATFEKHLTVTPRPVLFAGLLNAWGQLGPAEIPEKRIATYQFCAWKAKQLGLPYSVPPKHPFNPLPLLRMILARGSHPDDITAVFNAVWAHGLDVTDPAVIEDIRNGLGPVKGKAMSANDAKLALRQNTDDAVAVGVYGVPTFAAADAGAVKPRLFWGYDAGAWLLDWIANPGLFDDDVMRRAAACQIGVERPR